MGSLTFEDAETAAAFSHIMTETHCIDVSAQTYKANCPPVALTKLPLIATKSLVRRIEAAMRQTLETF